MSALTQFMKGLLVWLDLHIHLEDCSDQDREQGEYHVVEGDRPAQPERLSWSHGIEAVGQLHRSEDHIFVEKVQNHLCDSDVVEPPMIEQELPQETELTNCIIGHLSSTSPFLSENADADVGLHDHVDIVGTITNG